MNQNRNLMWTVVILTILVLSSALIAPSVMAQTPEATEMVDALPGQVIVIQSEDLSDGDVVVVPVQAEEDTAPVWHEWLIAGIAVSALVLLYVDRGRVMKLIANTLDQAYESTSPMVGDTIKGAFQDGFELGRKIAAGTPGTLDDEAVNRLLDQLQTGVIDKLQRDGVVPYPNETIQAFDARRAAKG